MKEKVYTVRTEVLDMDISKWRALDLHFGKDVVQILVSPWDFLKKIGLPNGASARFNPEENEFF